MIILQDDHQLPKFPSVAASPTPRVPERSSLHGLLPDYETSQAQVDGSHVKAALRRADARFWRAAAYATVIYLILSAVIATVIAKTVRHAYRPAPPPSAPWSDDDASSKGSAGYSVHLGEDTHLLDCNPWEIVDYNRSSRHYYSKFRTTLSAGGMFSVHSNVSAPQNGDGPHPVTGTLTVGLNPDRSVTDARLAVKMIAKRAELWTDVHVCLPGSADGKELWIYVPENLGSDSIYFDISLLYPHTSSPPLQVQSLATYLPVFQQHFGDLDPYVSFAKVTIQGAVSNITVDSLRGDKIRVKSSWAPITGFFNASESLTLDTMGAPIHTNITLVHTSKRKEPTFLSIDTGNSPIDAQITLLAPTASPLSLVRRPPAFHSELKTFNGPLHVAVAHSSTTPPAAVHLSAQNTLAECSVEMDRKYVGTFDVRTKLGAAEVREGGGGSVGAGNGTGAGVGVGERTYVYDLSAADRRFGWVGMGSRPTAWHSGGQGHVRVVSSLSTAKLILGET